MNKDKFSIEDKEKLIKFLNLNATKAVFKKITTKDLIEYFGLLSFIQKILIPKIDANILEILPPIKAENPVNQDEGKEG